MNLTPKQVEALPDHQRVLIKWRLLGRVGLTTQALATICGVDSGELITTLKNDKKLNAQFCYMINAPIWSVNAGWWYKPSGYSYNYGYSYHHSVKEGVTLGGAGSQKMWIRNLHEALEQVYPTTDGWQGLRGCKGTKELDNIAVDRRRILLDVASGKKSVC